jgi:hypothetical protein
MELKSDKDNEGKIPEKDKSNPHRARENIYSELSSVSLGVKPTDTSESERDGENDKTFDNSESSERAYNDCVKKVSALETPPNSPLSVKFNLSSEHVELPFSRIQSAEEYYDPVFFNDWPVQKVEQSQLLRSKISWRKRRICVILLMITFLCILLGLGGVLFTRTYYTC